MADNAELRKAVEAVQPENVKFSLRLSQSKPLYEAFKALREGPEWAGLTIARQRIIEMELRDFVLGGVALEVMSQTEMSWWLGVTAVRGRGVERLGRSCPVWCVA